MTGDAIVVGAGIVGAACAYYLAQEGFAVSVVDAGNIAGAATSAGMGHVVVLDASDALFALTAYSQRLLRELAPNVVLEPRGTLWVAEDDAQMETARAKRDAYVARGIGAAVLDAQALRNAEPALRPGLAGGLSVPGDMVIDPPLLARWLLNGVAVKEHAPVKRLADLEAQVIVNATGAAAPALTPGIPITPRKGHLVIAEGAAHLCRHQVAELGYGHDAAIACNVQPRATGQLLIGASRENVGWDASINQDLVDRMLRRAAHFLPSTGHILEEARTRIGFRPATPDNLPFIGAWPESPFWIAAGHEGFGITTALGTGRILADLVLGRTPAIDPAPYRPSRARGAM